MLLFTSALKDLFIWRLGEDLFIECRMGTLTFVSVLCTFPLLALPSLPASIQPSGILKNSSFFPPSFRSNETIPHAEAFDPHWHFSMRNNGTVGKSTLSLFMFCLSHCHSKWLKAWLLLSFLASYLNQLFWHLVAQLSPAQLSSWQHYLIQFYLLIMWIVFKNTESDNNKIPWHLHTTQINNNHV